MAVLRVIALARTLIGALLPGAAPALAAASLLAAAPAFAAASALAAAQSLTAAPSEYQLKAVFLFNFAQFVEWPPTAFHDAAAPLIIGVLGNDPFGAYLDEVVEGEQVKGRALVVKRFQRIEDIDICHILFVSSSGATNPPAGQAAFAGRAILTVSEAQRGADAGAMIQFTEVQKRIRLRIDVDAASAAGLTISSKLLRSAEIARPRGG